MKALPTRNAGAAGAGLALIALLATSGCINFDGEDRETTEPAPAEETEAAVEEGTEEESEEEESPEEEDDSTDEEESDEDAPAAEGELQESTVTVGEELDVEPREMEVAQSVGEAEPHFVLEELEITYDDDVSDEAQGAAEDGMVWAVFHLDVELTGDDDIFEYTEGQWNLRLTDQDGEEWSESYGVTGDGAWPSGEVALAVQIPADTAELQYQSTMRAEFEPVELPDGMVDANTNLPFTTNSEIEIDLSELLG